MAKQAAANPQARATGQLHEKNGQTGDPVTTTVPLRRRDRLRLKRRELAFRALAGPLFADAPKPTDPRQGFIGDCYLLSAMAAVARADPQRIRSMVRPSRDSSFSFTFHKPLGDGNYVRESVAVNRQVPVTVNDGQCVYCRTLPDGTREAVVWPQLMEKAYAEWKGGYHVIGEGGAVENVLEEFTGQPSRLFYVAEHHPEFLWQLLSRATREGWPTGVCTYGRRERPGLDELGFHPNHIVVFLGVHTLRGKRIIWLRDPFDKPACGTLTLPDPHGIYTLSWENFLTYFSEILVNSATAVQLVSRPYPRTTIRRALERSYVFRPLAADLLQKIAAGFVRRQVKACDYVFTAGAPADAYYIIQSGTVSVETRDAQSGRKKQLAVLSAGDQFGEMAILDNGVRSADVRAITDLSVYRLSAGSFRRWTERVPHLVERFRRRFELQVWMNQWCNRPITSVSLDSLLEAGREETYRKGQLIVREGEQPDSLYLILAGNVEMFARGPDGARRSLRELRCGDLFGEIAALAQVAHCPAVRALTSVKVLRLDMKLAASVMENFQVLQRQLAFIAARRAKRLSGRRWHR
jgi:CRP-like cAMP-binding protein